MRFLRPLWRLPALAVWFVIAFLCALPSQFLPRERKMKRNWRLVGFWARGILKILNIRIEMAGTLPDDRGVLIVANHTGYLDIAIHAGLSGVRFAPKKEIRSWPLLGFYVDFSYPVWIDRKARSKSLESLEAFKQTMAMGCPLIVYPEGTSTDGLHGLLPFKSTPFEAAVESGCRILPLVTHYIVEPGEMNPAWFGDQSFAPHVLKLLQAQRFTARIVVLPTLRAEKGTDRKALAAQVREKMLAAYNREMGTDYA